MTSALKEYNEINGNIQAAYHDAAVKLGLSDSEMDILYVICQESSGCFQSALYKKTGMTRSTVNSAVRKMEKDGLLYLTAGGGRNTKVNLTEKGGVFLSATVGKIMEIEREIWAEWTDEEREIFINLNKRYAARLREKIDALEKRK